MKYPEIYVLRHGQTEWNAEGRLQGALNSPLTALGRRQAEAQRDILASRDLEGFRALMSPQGRVVETAGLAVAPLMGRLEIDVRLREIEVGEWSGLHRDTLGVEYDPAEVPGETLALYEAAPGGEGLARLEKRCQAFLDDLTGPSVLITHGITGRMLRSLWLGMGQEGVSRMPGGQGIVFHLHEGGQDVLENV
ncbi:MAG: phosphoglycerate mutase family protein [Rhodobacteraceae bacterium]|nr:phosphoglycerate mutase family protein [Paracoccaceae bacterium]